MVILRATRRLQLRVPLGVENPGESDTALGDWNVNRLVIARQPLLLLVSSRSLLSMLTPARDVRTLPDRLPGLVADRLQRLGVLPALVQAEVAAMNPVITAPTRDRSVLGIMVDFAKSIPYYLSAHAWDASALGGIEDQLARTPCHAGRRAEGVVYPDQTARKLLDSRWRPRAQSR